MYEVVCGNIGRVYEGANQDKALRIFYYYVSQSKSRIGRASGEDVVIFREDGSILFHHEGTHANL